MTVLMLIYFHLSVTSQFVYPGVCELIKNQLNGQDSTRVECIKLNLQNLNHPAVIN